MVAALFCGRGQRIIFWDGLVMRAMTKTTAGRSRRSTAFDIAVLDTEILGAIGRALRAHYGNLVHAPLPEEFLDLLARLENDEQRRGPRRDAFD